MSTTSAKQKKIKHTEHYVVGRNFEEVCAQEIAAHDLYVMEIAKEMSRPKEKAKPVKSPK